MPINFPNSPSPNQLYTYDSKTWEWNGVYWEVYSALTSYITSAYTVGDGVSDISGVTGGNIALKSFSGVNITIIDSGDKLTFSGYPEQNVTGLYLPLSGGTVTGGTIFQSGLTANTISSTTLIIGSNQAPSLYTTTRVTSITASTGTTIYSFPTTDYISSFVDYNVSGTTGLRAGNLMAIWSGTSVNFTETSTNDIGNTTPLTFGYVISGSSAVLQASASTGTWIVKSIVRGL
jgi:hypothetical protein